MDGTTWTDPRYTQVVDEWDRMRERRAQRRRPCTTCLHGLGSILMVDLDTREPIKIPCPRCSNG